MRPEILAVLGAALCFSTTGTARALAGGDASSLAIGAARILLGGGILAVVALARRHNSALSGALTTFRNPREVLLIGLGAVCILADQAAFFAGTQLNGVAVGTVVAAGSAPIVTGVLEGVRERKLPRLRWTVSTALAIIGVAVLSCAADPTSLGSVQASGIVASVLAGVCYSGYTIASKELLSRGWSPSDAMGAMFGSSALLSIPVLTMAGTTWIATPAGFGLLVWLGVVTAGVAFLLFAWGLARLSATSVSTLTLAEPLSATVLGLVVLGEQLTPAMIAGIGLIAVGLSLLAVPIRRRVRAGV